MTELLSAAKGSPLLLAALVILGAVVYAVEKLGGINGPITRLWGAWQNRELNRLRRESLIRAEKARIAREEETGRVADLQAQVDGLRATIEWQVGELNDYRRRERLLSAHERAVGEYLARLLHAARAAGIAFADPPAMPELSPLLVMPEDAAGLRRNTEREEAAGR